MIDRVHILATCLNPALLDGTLLVFKTVRTGFPKAWIKIHGNGLTGKARDAVISAAQDVKAMYSDIDPTAHDRWIVGLVQTYSEPFWICDTDIVFNAKVEGLMPWHKEDAFSGTLEPEFLEDWTRTWHVERLHTALMWINPERLRQEFRCWACNIPEPWRNSAVYPFIEQTFIPRRNEEWPLFYDTMAGAWQAGIGRPFSDGLERSYDHLHCGTYADKIDAPGLIGLAKMHQAVYADIAAVDGIRAVQEEYYRQQKEKLYGKL